MMSFSFMIESQTSQCPCFLLKIVGREHLHSTDFLLEHWKYTGVGLGKVGIPNKTNQPSHSLFGQSRPVGGSWMKGEGPFFENTFIVLLVSAYTAKFVPVATTVLN